MMASTPGSSFSDRSGALHTDTNDRKTTRAILPPSPSTVRFTDNSDIDGATEAYNIIWDSFCGLPTRDAYPSFSLPDQQAYDRLCEKVSEHDGLLSYFNESLRKDWNAETGILTLRLMPSPMHEHFQDCLIDAIKKELNRIATEYLSL
ncbi:hypothetical protein NPX13_g2101 [Xylaria arbuscula]|uniref:Uncharacterized protein n=1 Tax=Xylaria arbuscula TaxID=114810 RepID=A0A9W8NK85_9PEZI|nr:hypothetical protein NPX13_g2101 [Xylaria arbuscula]